MRITRKNKLEWIIKEFCLRSARDAPAGLIEICSHFAGNKIVSRINILNKQNICRIWRRLSSIYIIQLYCYGINPASKRKFTSQELFFKMNFSSYEGRSEFRLSYFIFSIYFFFIFAGSRVLALKKKFSSENLFNSSEQVLKSFLVNNL